MRDRILAAILDFVEETEKRKKKITRQIPQGQYVYCKYLEIIQVGVFAREQKQVAGAAAAGGLSKNNKSPPPHSGWRLKYLSYIYCWVYDVSVAITEGQ